MSDQHILMAALARGLVDGGVAHACVSPGSRSTPLALALHAEERVRCWSHIDERSGAFFGLGIAKSTGRPVALLCTSGTAAAEFHPAVIEARHARVPLVVLTADRPPLLRDCGAGQTIDQIKLYGSDVKWFFEAAGSDSSADSVRFFRSLGARAAAAATAGPPGPVHLNIPLGDPLSPTPGALASAPLEVTARDPRPGLSHAEGRLAPDPAVIDKLSALIRATEEGIIVCGEHADDDSFAEAVRELALTAGYPVIAEPISGLRAGPHAGEHIIDAYDALLRVERFAAARRPSLVIRLGGMPTSKRARNFLLSCLTEAPSAPRGKQQGPARQLLVDPWGPGNDPIHAATDLLRADPALTCRALTDAIRGHPRAGSPWLKAWVALNARVRAALDRAVDGIEELFEGRIARDLARALPEGSTLFVGSSMPIRDVETFFPRSERALRILSNRGANGIDGVISTALGVAAISTGPSALLIGDLSFIHDLGGLLAAARHGIGLAVVVVNNDGGGIFHFLPQTAHRESFENLFATPHGLDLSHAARLFRLPYRLVADATSFSAVIREALEAGDTRIIEVRTDPKRNVELHEEIQRAAAEALGDG